MKSNIDKSNGFTVFEFLIYLALVAVFSVAAISFLLEFVRSEQLLEQQVLLSHEEFIKQISR